MTVRDELTLAHANVAAGTSTDELLATWRYTLHEPRTAENASIMDACSRELSGRNAPEDPDELTRCACGYVWAWHDEVFGTCPE